VKDEEKKRAETARGGDRKSARAKSNSEIGSLISFVSDTAAKTPGLKITTVQYGARKTEQYPTAPLSKDARARMQAEIDTLGEMFVRIRD
jgi:capsid assembly protease